jgi:ketosteroid isomerase-like protein
VTFDVSHAADEIRQLKHEYCWAFDEGDLDGLMALFTDDAVCELGAFGSWNGRAEILAGYRNQLVLSGVPGGRLHSVSNSIIRVDGETATGRWYLVDYDISSGTTEPVRILATYRDAYRWQGDRWLIARTSLTIHWSVSTSVTNQS